MKLKFNLLFLFASIGMHIYLTYHYYDLSLGILSEKSICNLGGQFNCDVVSASRFSSLMGIPMATWGAVTNMALAILVMGQALSLTSDSARTGRYAFWLSGYIALVSVVMAIISTFFVGSLCVFCILTYLLSFIVFALIQQNQLPERKSDIEYIKEIFQGKAVAFLVLLVAIPASAMLMDFTVKKQYGAGKLAQQVKYSVNDWLASEATVIETPPLFVKGSSQPKMVITEFADFRCGHCKMASNPISAFLGAHSDVQLRFHVFPLDGTCNEALKASGGDGVSCYLAKLVYCSEQKAQKGSLVHEEVFALQNTINAKPSMDHTKNLVNEMLTRNGLDPEALNQCVDSAEALAAIKAQGAEGAKLKIKGTPSFFVNGKPLQRGSLIHVLEATYQTIK